MREDLEKRIPKALLDKEWLGNKLREFRERHGFATLQAIQKETGLTGLFRNEDGTQFPGWPALVKVVYACRTTLAQFFAEIEGVPAKSHGVEILPEHSDLYEMLTTILRSRNPRRIHGITVNLEDISAAAEREMEKKSEPDEAARPPTTKPSQGRRRA